MAEGHGAPAIVSDGNRKVFPFGDLKFWAEGGQIRIVNERTGEYHCVGLKDWKERIGLLALALRRTRYGDERQTETLCLERMARVARQAEAQGDPSDDVAFAELSRSRPRQQILVPRSARTAAAPGGPATIEDFICTGRASAPSPLVLPVSAGGGGLCR